MKTKNNIIFAHICKLDIYGQWSCIVMSVGSYKNISMFGLGYLLYLNRNNELVVDQLLHATFFEGVVRVGITDWV